MRLDLLTTKIRLTSKYLALALEEENQEKVSVCVKDKVLYTVLHVAGFLTGPQSCAVIGQVMKQSHSNKGTTSRNDFLHV